MSGGVGGGGGVKVTGVGESGSAVRQDAFDQREVEPEALALVADNTVRSQYLNEGEGSAAVVCVCVCVRERERERERLKRELNI